MKKIIGAVVILAAFVALADRTDVWLAASVDVYKVELFKLSDGGCSVSAYANLSNAAGGTDSQGTRSIEVAGANRTTCLDILNNKAPLLFKTDKGL